MYIFASSSLPSSPRFPQLGVIKYLSTRMLGAHGLSHLKSSSLSTLSAWRKNLLQSLLMHAATRRVLQSLLSRLRRKHLAAQPRTESRLQPPNKALREKDRPGREKDLLLEAGSWEEEGTLKTGRKDLRRHEGERVCVKWSKKWAAEVTLEERAGARQEGSGAGGAAPGPAGAPGPQRAWAARMQPTAPVRAAGALPAAPGAGVCVGRGGGGGGVKSGIESSLKGRRGRDSGPTPNRAPPLNYL